MDNRTNYHNDNHNSSPVIVAELADLGLSVDSLYDGVSAECPCCVAASQQTRLAA